MSAIKVYKAELGICYNSKTGKYLGKFLRTGERVRNSEGGTAGQSLAPIYVFENETIQDTFPAAMVTPTPCIASAGAGERGGSRRNRKNKKARKNRRRTCRRN